MRAAHAARVLDYVLRITSERFRRVLIGETSESGGEDRG